MTAVRTDLPTLRPSDLADRLARREPVTVLDIRDDTSWSIEAPGLDLRNVPSAVLLADPGATAAELNGEVAVVCNRGISAQRATEALLPFGVDAAVLEGGMRGWIGVLQARPLDLGVAGLTAWQVQRPGRGCLSYLLAAGGEAIVVDPAPDAAFYVALAERAGAAITAVVDTHLHADHLSGARDLAERTGAALRLSAAALERGVAYADAVVPLHDGDALPLGEVEIGALGLPGHTTDMTGLLVADRALIAGDSLFADGIARPDLQEGDPEGARRMARLLHATLHDRVLALGDDVILLPGHGHAGVLAEAIAPRLGDVRTAVAELALDDADAFAEAVLAAMPPRPANYEAVIAANAGLAPLDPDLESGGNSCATR